MDNEQSAGLGPLATRGDSRSRPESDRRPDEPSAGLSQPPSPTPALGPRATRVRRPASFWVSHFLWVVLGAVCVVSLATGLLVWRVDRSDTPTSPNQSEQDMSAPPGYTNQQLILADRFAGADLDTQKWSTYLGAQGIIWNNYGRLPVPYSAPNASPLEDELAMFGPSQVSVHNGLTLTAQANTTRFAKTYPWISGVTTTEGKVSLPATGWYVQVKAKMPDMTAGMWPAIWFMPDTSTSKVPEIDLFEGGWKSPDPNETMHADYGGGAGQYPGYRDIIYNTKTDLSAGYHIYGIQYIPHVSVKYFFDGTLVFEQSASDKGGVPAGTYELLLQLQVASPQTSQWHTVATASSPSQNMDIAEVQAYS